MTDKELLEAAARAAGIDGMWFANDAPDSPMFFHQPGRSVYGVWNPLTDDGDALRLAVKLRMSIDMNPLSVWVHASRNISQSVTVSEDRAIDDAPQVRRAIVRAAAAMAGDA